MITDFGADEPLNKINQKLKEHYAIEVATDSARKITGPLQFSSGDKPIHER